METLKFQIAQMMEVSASSMTSMPLFSREELIEARDYM
jgi:hypothetical protein